MKILHDALEQKDLEKIKSIVKERGVEAFYDVNVNNVFHPMSLLHYMMYEENLLIVQFLVEQGWDVNRKNKLKNVSIFYLLNCENEMLKTYLINQGIDLNMKSNIGLTPLMFSAQFLNIKDLKWLFVNGADPNIGDDDGDSFLHYLCDEGMEELLPLFLQNEERWNEKNWNYVKGKRMELLFK